MRRIALMFLSFLCLVGCSNQLPNFNAVEQKLYMNISGPSPITLTPFAKKIGGALYSPKFDKNTATSTITVNGYIKQYQQLTEQYVWIQITYQGSRGESLPDTFQYYTPIKQGNFIQTIKLFAGLGDYDVQLFVSNRKPNQSFYPFAKFTVTNQDPNTYSDISYSLQAKEMNLSLYQPLSGFVIRNTSIELSGSVEKQLARNKLLVQIQKGNQKWQKVISVSKKATFHETIPLLYGQGIHEIQVMLPYRQKKNTYVNGATLYVENDAGGKQTPVEYSTMYESRGIHLTEPIAGGGQGEYFYPIAGYIDQSANQASETTHLIVQTKKNSLVATYFVPINHYHFHYQIPLRFGSGNYDIILFVPEITAKQQDYFRFFMVAKFGVNSYAKEDLRDLLPSRGINPDNPRIYNLARKITASAGDNYERAKLIYRFVAHYMSYDVTKFEQDSFAWDDSDIKSLQLRKGVCQDYVFLTISLLRSLQIPARFIEGVAGGQNHAWVEAYVSGKWIIMDPTWGSGFIDPQSGFIKHYDGRFFDISRAQLAKTHKQTGVVY